MYRINRNFWITIFALCFVRSTIAGDYLTEHVVKSNFDNACSIAGVDLDGDGDIDMVATSYDGHYISWFENDGKQNFIEHRIIENFSNARVLDVGHIDEDDDYDIIATAQTDSKISWFENDGKGNFTEHVIIKNWIGSGFVMVRDHFNNIDLDMDNDGDTDILASSIDPGNKICWFENDGSQNFTEHVIKDNWYWARYSTVSDIDQDGDIDVIGTAKAGQVIWFENDGSENFSEHVIISNWGEPSSVQCADLDKDGDIDLAATSVTAREVAWFENDGNNNFTKHLIRDQFNGAFSVTINDIDQDNDYDILAIAWIGGLISVFQNDGAQNFSEYLFCDHAYDMIKIFPTDLDSDGDTDILGACYSSNDIRWWENNFYGFGYEVNPLSGHAPLAVQFTDKSKFKDIATFRTWDFENDGIVDSDKQNLTWNYNEPGTYSIKLEVSHGGIIDTIMLNDYITVFDGESALEFDGNTSNVKCPASPSLNITENFTIEAWINPYSWGKVPNLGFGRIIDKQKLSLFLMNTNTTFNDHSLILKISHADGAMSTSMTPVNSINLDVWQHVAVTYDVHNNEVRMFLNGTEQEVTQLEAPSGPVADNSNIDLYIGNTNNLQLAFKGSIDEVRIWNSIRTPAEIQENMNCHLTKGLTEMIGCWGMNEANGDTLFDISKNHNNGEIMKASWIQGLSSLEPTSVENNLAEIIPDDFILFQNYPNPFNPETNIWFELKKVNIVELKIYDINGRLTKTLVHERKAAGTHHIKWDGTDNHNRKVCTGMYLCKLVIGANFKCNKILLMK